MEVPVNLISISPGKGESIDPAKSLPFTQILSAVIFERARFLSNYSSPSTIREDNAGGIISRVTLNDLSIWTSSPAIGRVPPGQINGLDQTKVHFSV